MLPEKETRLRSRKQLIDTITVLLARSAAEREFLGEANVTTGAADDYARATEVARAMVFRWGSSLGPAAVDADRTEWSQGTLEKMESDVFELLHQAASRAANMIGEHRGKVLVLANELIDKEELDAVAIERLLGCRMERAA